MRKKSTLGTCEVSTLPSCDTNEKTERRSVQFACNGLQLEKDQSRRGSIKRLNSCSAMSKFFCFCSATYKSKAISFI